MQRNTVSGGLLRVVLAVQLVSFGPGTAPAFAGSSNSNNDEATAIHVLNRLTFGPRPADLAKVRQMGVMDWIESQLRPATSTDTALAARLAPLETLSMGTAELREKYEIPPNIRQQIQKARAERDTAAGQPGTRRGPRPGAGPLGPQRTGRSTRAERRAG